MRVGIFGGTFDPPHLSHLILAAEAHQQLALDRLLFVLTADPPHKRGRVFTPVEQRLAMVTAAVADNPAFEVSLVEVNRPGPHYAVDSLEMLKAEHDGAELVYLMGGDSLRTLASWRRPVEFVAACEMLGVMRRPYDEIDLKALEAQLPGVSAKLRFIEAPLLEISSRQIRRRIAEGRPYRYFLHPAVFEIIRVRDLYRN
ncbi:MAG: nicotinate-nucleotide adenylyltransferase [Anaerolineae bacterium]|nr:nicotinate-nucleotide adenylyltransferase [Anaerolineae bacterium]